LESKCIRSIKRKKSMTLWTTPISLLLPFEESTLQSPHDHSRQVRRWVDQHQHASRKCGACGFKWMFRLTIAGIALTDEQLDALFEADLRRRGVLAGRTIRFSDSSTARRETQEDAVLSAIGDVEAAGIGARVLQVTRDDDWLTASEIDAWWPEYGVATLGNWSVATGTRGFPAPVARHGLPNHCGWAGPTLKHGSGVTIPLRFGNEGRRCHRTSWPSSTTGWTYESAFSTLLTLPGAQGW
jgi:hypothetical protein